MALQDIKNYRVAIKEVYRVLKEEGRFLFVILHPCFERRTIGNRIIGGWQYKKGTNVRSTENALYKKVDRYFDTRTHVISWNSERLTRYFKTTSFHRPLTDYAVALYNAGFLISRLKEPRPTKRGLKKYPIFFKKELRIPSSIVIEAVRC